MLQAVKLLDFLMRYDLIEFSHIMTDKSNIHCIENLDENTKNLILLCMCCVRQWYMLTAGKYRIFVQTEAAEPEVVKAPHYLFNDFFCFNIRSL